jgi:hypothetical protein
MYVLVDIRYVIDNYEKTGCNRLQLVFYGFLKFFKLRQPATEPTTKRGNRNRWSGCFRLRSVRFWCFFRFRELDLQTLFVSISLTDELLSGAVDAVMVASLYFVQSANAMLSAQSALSSESMMVWIISNALLAL